MNNVLVTGGAGFVGRAFVRRLLSDGCRVTVIDDLSAVGARRPEPHLNLIFQKVDCRPYFRYTPHCEFDTVIHLAAVVGGRLKIDGDPLAVATDLSIDAELFNWVAKVPKKPQVLYFSSSAAYPINRQRSVFKEPPPVRGIPQPLREDELFGDAGAMLELLGVPDMTYGWAKLTGEYLVGFAARQYDVDVKIYRPFSGYGPEQALDYPFPSIVRRVMNCEGVDETGAWKRHVVVWGSGDQLRDFIYIDDVVDAVLATKDKLAPGEALNLGSGVGVSFKELAFRVAAVLGKQVDVINDPTKPEGVFARVADATKFRSLYDKPLTSLERGIEKVIEGLTTGAV